VIVGLIFPIAKKVFKNYSPDGAATLPKIINLKGQLKHPENSQIKSFPTMQLLRDLIILVISPS
jgi:hypothetical protein